MRSFEQKVVYQLVKVYGYSYGQAQDTFDKNYIGLWEDLCNEVGEGEDDIAEAIDAFSQTCISVEVNDEIFYLEKLYK